MVRNSKSANEYTINKAPSHPCLPASPFLSLEATIAIMFLCTLLEKIYKYTTKYISLMFLFLPFVIYNDRSNFRYVWIQGFK